MVCIVGKVLVLTNPSHWSWDLSCQGSLCKDWCSVVPASQFAHIVRTSGRYLLHPVVQSYRGTPQSSNIDRASKCARTHNILPNNACMNRKKASHRASHRFLAAKCGSVCYCSDAIAHPLDYSNSAILCYSELWNEDFCSQVRLYHPTNFYLRIQLSVQDINNRVCSEARPIRCRPTRSSVTRIMARWQNTR